MNDFLTEDTKAITLLCGVFGRNRSVKPLSLTEYSLLVRWLVGVKMRPKDLFEKETIAEASMGSGIDKQRLESLLGRGVQLGFVLEEWQRNGIWIISRSDVDYPARYKKHLKDKAPPLLFGVGNRSLLSGGGLGIVGSRNVDQAGETFTRQVAELCAYNSIPVVSGGARGVDQISMTTALEAGGVSVGILAENLLRKSVERKNRQAIADGRLLLLSPYHPNSRFTVGTAMGRNKLIYGMSDYSIIVSAEYKKGGTWAGAEEELKRKKSLPVFVRVGNNAPQGNSKLLDLGAISWPESIDRKNFGQQLNDLAIKSQQEVNPTEEQAVGDPEIKPQPSQEVDPIEEQAVGDPEIKPQPSQEVDPIEEQAIGGPEVKSQPPQEVDAIEEQAAGDPEVKSQLSQEVDPVEEQPPATEPANEKQAIGNLEVKTQECPSSIYQAVLPVILNELNSPATTKELAETLDVNKAQLNVWLKKAMEENKITKLSRPVRYQKTESGKQMILQI
jgi:predicted Rossmann fold nucleotide-binding protein DprA/Smf involved in DNA uptake